MVAELIVCVWTDRQTTRTVSAKRKRGGMLWVYRGCRKYYYSRMRAWFCQLDGNRLLGCEGSGKAELCTAIADRLIADS